MSPLAALTIAALLTSTADVRVVLDDGAHVWLGTTGGLVAFAHDDSGDGGDGDDGDGDVDDGDAGDAHAERRWTTLEGLPDVTVRALHREGGTLWIGTDRGLARLDVATGEVARVGHDATMITALARQGDTLVIGAWDGLYRLDGESLVRVASMEHVTGVAASPDGLYVTTAGRGTFLVVLGAGAAPAAAPAAAAEAGAAEEDSARVRRLRGDRLAWGVAVRNGVAAVATSAGVVRYRRGRVLRRGSSDAVLDARAVAWDGDALVVGTWGRGVVRIAADGTDTPVTEQPAWLARAQVQAVAVGAGGTLTVGTTAGAARASNGYAEPARRGLPDNDLTALARTAEGLFIGTFTHGLALVRDDDVDGDDGGAGAAGAVEVFDEAHGLVDDRINRLTVDADGDLWVATDRGVMEREHSATGRGRWVFRGLLDRHVFMIAAAHDAVYAGAGDALYRFDRAVGRFVEVPHPGHRPQDAFAHGGALYVATAEGLAILRDTTWTLRTSEHGLADDWVTAVAALGDDIVVGTYNAGVARLSTPPPATDASTVGDRAPPLARDLWVNAGAMISLSQTRLAVGTLDGGLALFDGPTTRILTTTDGLPDADVTALLRERDGTLLVATRGGLATVR